MKFEWLHRIRKNSKEKPTLSKSYQKELLDRRDIYADSELHFVFLSYNVPEEFMRKVFYKFGPPPAKDNFFKVHINDWIHWQKVSEGFLREFKDYIDFNIASWKTMSDDFLREYRNELDWVRICQQHEFSAKLVKEFKDKIRWDILERRGYHDEKYKKIFE